MYYLPTSSLVLFFLFSSFHHLSCASSDKELGWCKLKFQCGNITAGFPYWGGNRPKPCGHPLLKLECIDNTITSLSISDHLYHVFDIDHTSNTLKLARTHLFESSCSSLFTNATLPSEMFNLLPAYKSVTLYHCNHSSCTPWKDTTTLYGYLHHHESCNSSFTLNVPRSFNTKEEKVNITNLISDLFEVKLKIDMKACQECSPIYGFCVFDKFKPLDVKCIPLHTPTDAGLSAGPIADAGLSSKATLGFKLASGLIVVILIAGSLFCVIIYKRKTSDDLIRQQKLKALIPLKHYSYARVKRITKSFAEVVGKGGFGTVYRGTLCDGRSVAVKILKDSKGNGEDFINEVASMSKTSHVNIVSLLGFCSEGSKRAIIYEFLEKGSLYQFISSNSSMNMDWMALYGIALGVARGLEYLHHGCKTRIVHFDIKPQNVLLDDNLCPKVSDFGLAKLCEKKDSILSLLDTRGTIGYIAPEVFSRIYGRVSDKSDVYSYGMLILEMIGARKKTSPENSASSTSTMYFPEWIYKDLENGDDQRLNRNEINNKEEDIAKKMTLVGLWCIQPSPQDRPAMNRVVEMMEGNLDALQIPPRPTLQIPSAPFQESSTLSEDISIYNEV